jgi:hypothetical protein
MFESIQPVKNRRAVYAAASGTAGERDAIVDDRYVRRACREFLEALRAYAAFNPEASSSIGSEPTTHRQDLEEIAYENMERALQKIRSLRVSLPAGLQAKFEALFGWKTGLAPRILGLSTLPWSWQENPTHSYSPISLPRVNRCQN